MQPPSPPTPPTTEQLRIAAQILHLQIQLGATVEIVRRLAEHVGMKDIDGLPLEQAFNGLCDDGVRDFLIGMEEVNPALAAALSEIIDRSRGKEKPLF